MQAIKGFFGSYRYLSNFYIEPDGTFVEWEFQRAKCAVWSDRTAFNTLMDRGTLTPKQAKAIGGRVKIREDWEDCKVDIMQFYVAKKFRDHPNLAKLLRATGKVHLEETNTWGDRFWGVDGTGLNILGEILMEMREKLRG